jgi:hypothetical protein
LRLNRNTTPPAKEKQLHIFVYFSYNSLIVFLRKAIWMPQKIPVSRVQ